MIKTKISDEGFERQEIPQWIRLAQEWQQESKGRAAVVITMDLDADYDAAMIMGIGQIVQSAVALTAATKEDIREMFERAVKIAKDPGMVQTVNETISIMKEIQKKINQ